ncbi:MAG: tyrosine-type recombinase/integrase [Candidatus Methylomirabilis sp.]
MGDLRDRMLEDLTLAGYSPSTVRIYLHYARSFAKHYMRSPAAMGKEEVRAYLLHLLDTRKLSHDTYRQAHAAIKFLYTVTLDRPVEVQTIPRHRRQRPLPDVLSGTEVQALLDAVRNPKYRVALMTIYAAGLRVSEACHLHVPDIDSKRRVIHVRLGKGAKDRYVMLSERLLGALREYWKISRPHDVLFPGRYGRGHIDPSSVRATLACAASEISLKKKVTPHVLRHSFATHLLELGTSIRVVQALLGHAHIDATAGYTNVSSQHIQRVRSPFDVLGTAEASVLG